MHDDQIHLSFTVPSRPVAYVRTTRRQMHADPYYAKYRDYKQYFSTMALQALQKDRSFYCDERCMVRFEAVVYLKKGRRIDIDNILKTFFDGCNKIIWDDDSQVVQAYIEKVYIPKESDEYVEVRIWRNA